MTYPQPTAEHIRRFREDGYLIVEDVIDRETLAKIGEVAQHIIQNKERLAYDWDWRKDEPILKRQYLIVQKGGVARDFPALQQLPYQKWMADFATALMGSEMGFWYDQFLAKPPRLGVPTPWHQDEGYWGKRQSDRAITCWMSLHDVDVSNGCMHFIPGGHKLGILEHNRPETKASDQLVCDIGNFPAVAVPLRVGGVTFHHSKMPHMTTGNSTDRWRLSLTQHFCDPAFTGEGDHYPWRVVVNQWRAKAEAEQIT